MQSNRGQWQKPFRSSGRRRPDYRVSHRNLEHWFRSPLGQALLEDQRACVNTHVQDLGGARQLHIALSHRLPLAADTDYTQHIVATPYWHAELPDGVVVCDPDELPLPSASIDLVILHHSADFSAWPHQVLRESARVLRGGGQLLVLGFNPLSSWGIRRLLSRRRRGPWGGRFLLRSRMEDWLNLLDFTVESSGSYFFRLPLQNERLLERRSALEYLGTQGMLPVGAYYCILASKRVCAPIARRRLWRPGKVIPLPTPGTLGASRQARRQEGPGRNAEGC
ncbi:Methyltransferase domain-containing protein [Marinobacter segnicrescens]|uniref:Methyltransferase domain-containing protein n=1 Tax=Marinobacter segnicrescens TaxID=430453 RepID=A0A1I0D1A6_9GAMM|nr:MULTISPECIES: class I SAM-dependent methyltransferase [Marinobacter]UZD67551.1 class I SAM-dependent methyltransferase [Marinobacter sp. AN1]SET25942.1 Methyltransferase domain-containing protein [Marinobacter segnicrescens]